MGFGGDGCGMSNCGCGMGCGYVWVGHEGVVLLWAWDPDQAHMFIRSGA